MKKNRTKKSPNEDGRTELEYPSSAYQFFGKKNARSICVVTRLRIEQRNQESRGQSRDQEQFLGVVPGTFRFADFTRFTKMAY